LHSKTGAALIGYYATMKNLSAPIPPALLIVTALSLPLFGAGQLESVSAAEIGGEISAEGPAISIPQAPPLSPEAEAMLEQVKKRITNLGTAELKMLLEQHPQTQLVGVRTPMELALLGGHIDAPKNRNIMRGWMDLKNDGLIPNKDTPIVVYCGVNQRSPLAAEALIKRGYKDVKNYADGFFAWKAAGLPVKEPDKALNSILYSMPQEVIPGVWSAIGATAPPTYDNSGHNNNLSFIITDDGVVVMNAGESYLLAQALHAEIRRLTDQPVKYVVLENGQGHAMLGSSYWREQNAKIIMHADAWHEVEERSERIENRAAARRDKNFNMQITKPDILLEEDRLELQLGSWRMEVLRLGPAHSPGDIMLWIPDRKLVITGDFAFHERLLPVFEDTDTAGWIDSWNKFIAMKPEHIIPGHGSPTTDMNVLVRYTRDYLVYMRAKIGEILDNGGGLTDAYKIDQSAYAHLDTFDELALRNAATIFKAMEFE